MAKEAYFPARKMGKQISANPFKQVSSLSVEHHFPKHDSMILWQSSTLYVDSPSWNMLGGVLFGTQITGLALQETT